MLHSNQTTKESFRGQSISKIPSLKIYADEAFECRILYKKSMTYVIHDLHITEKCLPADVLYSSVGAF